MFFIQDGDADFMAKLAKLMSAAGTQLLNSYSKYDSMILFFIFLANNYLSTSSIMPL